MELVGYIAAALIGISLSLIGGGGSILTVPVMVYLFSVTPSLATSYSLFIVGTASAIGAYANYRKGLISVKTALLFGISSIITVFCTRKFIVAAIPENIGTLYGFDVTKSFLIMVLFSLLMLIASVYMINDKAQNNDVATQVKLNVYKLSLYGIAIGFISGILGIGGGFILIPALVLLVGMPMKKAVGTSLFIIALNCFVGFTGDFGHFTIDWFFLLKITTIAVAGIFAGSIFSKKVQGEKLKKTFGWFVMIMATCILINAIFPGKIIKANNTSHHKISKALLITK